MKKIEITRRLEFDAGHRIPNHAGHCRHIHGHRYKLEITVRGNIIATEGAEDEGMLIDFGLIKKIGSDLVVDKLDHAFIVSKSDNELINFLSTIKGHKTVVLNEVPTVENIAEYIFQVLAPEIKKQYKNKLHLTNVRLYETPNCWADVNDDS